MRSVDLAVYADALAAEAAALAARLERARGRLRQLALEREARAALPPETVERLGALGLLSTQGGSELVAELEGLRLDLVAVERLQGWVEAQLEGHRDLRALDRPPATSPAGREAARAAREAAVGGELPGFPGPDPPVEAAA